MRAADALTMERGIPGIVLMENAAARVVEFLESRFAPLEAERVAILCGKGNNGGDGLAIARQIRVKHPAADLRVFLAAAPGELAGDAAANLRMWHAVGGSVEREITPAMRSATLVLDALLGTGLTGSPKEPYAALIQEINRGFPNATIVAVDIPSGMPSDTAEAIGPCVQADHTVTFTAPKLGQVLPPNCESTGELITAPIGTSDDILATVSTPPFYLADPAAFAPLFAPRPRDSNKGTYGHVLVAGGAPGKTGAAEMCGEAALRIGAGLVTVAMPEPVALRRPELMTATLAAPLEFLLDRKTVVAAGPGLGHQHRDWVRRLALEIALPLVIDADALQEVAGLTMPPASIRVLTPHPGEMARIISSTVEAVQRDRLAAACALAARQHAAVVLKGYRTIIAWPDGEVWINPTGSPALAKGGTGDVLAGFIAGLLAQHPEKPRLAVAAAVWLHGRCGDLASAVHGDCSVLATDLFAYLPAAIEECASA